jgi:DNA-binding transcriptional LysR family regulator
MNLRNVDLNLLTVFDAVIRDGNQTRAAERIGMSQPAMSAALGRLRLLFGDELFTRTGHGMKPTPRALQFARPVRQILDLVVMTLSETSSFDFVTSTRNFNLALREYGELVILPRLMQWLDGMAATVTINTRAAPTDQMASALQSGAIDLHLTTEPIPFDDYVNLHVTDDTMVSMIRRDHPQVRGGLGLDQFLSMRHVVLAASEPQGWLVEQKLRSAGLSRNCAMNVHTLFDMPRVVAATDMVCSMPARMARHFAEVHKLQTFPTPVHGLNVPIYLIWHQRFDPDPGHRWIRSAIADLLRD